MTGTNNGRFQYTQPVKVEADCDQARADVAALPPDDRERVRKKIRSPMPRRKHRLYLKTAAGPRPLFHFHIGPLVAVTTRHEGRLVVLRVLPHDDACAYADSYTGAAPTGVRPLADDPLPAAIAVTRPATFQEQFEAIIAGLARAAFDRELTAGLQVAAETAAARADQLGRAIDQLRGAVEGVARGSAANAERLAACEAKAEQAAHDLAWVRLTGEQAAEEARADVKASAAALDVRLTEVADRAAAADAGFASACGRFEALAVGLAERVAALKTELDAANRTAGETAERAGARFDALEAPTAGRRVVNRIRRALARWARPRGPQL